MDSSSAAQKGYTPEIRLRLVTFPYWRWVMEVVYV